MASNWRSRRTGGRAIPLLGAALILVAAAIPAAAEPAQPGFLTGEKPMLTNLSGGAEPKPIITVGDTIGDYMFEAIPDGIAMASNGRGTVDVYVNHETSTVPFPYPTPAVPPTASNAFNDFTDSLVSKLRLQQRTAGVLSASFVVTDDENFHRLCSNYIADASAGFKRPMLLTNEEGTDWVNREGTQWPATVGDEDARQIGGVVAHDLRSGQNRVIWGMGRHNHENSLAVPGYGHPVVLSGDDTFTSNPAQSQVYSYIAPNSDAVWNDTGKLYAFRADNFATFNDYYDFPVGSAMSIPGQLIEVPKNIATGRNADGTDLMAADVGYPLPQNTTPPHPFANSAGTTTPIDGPQWVLEHWSDLNNVFQFVRIEDMAFDKRPGMSNVVYLADSGRGSASTSGNAFASTNGRIWRMVLDPTNPTEVLSLSILIEGDDAPLKTLAEIRQPDNLETTPVGLYITEDTSTAQQFAPSDTAGRNARVWQYKFSNGALTDVLEVNQAADNEDTDEDGAAAPGNKGAWEASGILDVSSVFGPGMFLIDVQAHTLYVDTAPGPDLVAPTGPDWTIKREGGQLLLVHIPGG